MSLPARPLRVLLPVLPVMRLLLVLPVPLILPVPVRVRVSNFAAKTVVTLAEIPSVMVTTPVPCNGDIIALPVALLNLTVKVSSPSTIKSSVIGTVIVAVLTPAAKERVPVAAVKSEPAVAVTPAMVY